MPATKELLVPNREPAAGLAAEDRSRDIAALGSWELDLRANEFHGSDGFFRIYGQASDATSLPFDRVMAAIYAADRELVNRTLERILQSHEPFDIEHRVVRQDGTIVIVRNRGQVVADQSGKAVRLVGTAHDITEFRLAHERLRHSEEKFRSLVANIPDVTWTSTVDGETPYVSPNVEQVFGYTAEEMCEKGDELWYGRIHPSQSAEIAEAFSRLFTEGKPFDVEYRAQRKDGRWIWVHDRAYRTYERDGVRYADGIFSDITERRRAEEALKESLATSERALKDLADQKFALDQHAIVAITDVQGTITYVNEKFCALSQYSREELIGRNHRILNSGHHERNFFQEMYQTIAHGKVWNSEIKNRAKDGTFYWVDTTIVPFVGEDGKPRQYVAIRADVTKRKLADEEMRKAKEAAEAANLAKSQFLANMSHEIRTPMNGVIGVAGLLLDTELTPEQRQYAEIVRTSGEALLRVVNDILDFSKIEARKLTLDKSDFDLDQVLKDAVTVLAMKASQRGLKLRCELEPGMLCSLRGDSGRLRQILINLVGNAVKFTAHGEITVSVRVEAKDADNVRLRFGVRDTGVGFPQEKAAALFEPFVQADGSSTRRYGGTGLGLTISKQLVGLMGGEIGAQSEEGKGSTFWFTAVFEKQHRISAPAAVEAAKSASATTPIGRPLKDSARQNRMRILLAEDNLTNQEVAVAMLGKLGHRVDVVADGAEAIEALRREPYDLVLMDCMMPQVDGYEATRRIREGRTGARNPQIAIVALTADAMSGDRDKCMDAGMNDYLAKPVDLLQLDQILRKWVNVANNGEEDPVAGEPPNREEVVFNQEEFLGRLMGDKALAGKVLGGFLSDTPQQLLALNGKLKEGDAQGAKLLAHTIKGSAATMSADVLRAVSFEVQEAIAAGNLEQALRLMPQLEKQFEVVKTALREWGWI